ncbi:FAD-dependent oxidoreductase [Flammeovirga pacifica]|uniref:FAD-binding dehydrogenase n=1 Tax=Flammeovirga pacifica TaxID=915059 RepID=A0A1S1YSU4_FLAPC|nr:FAD-dependent oxidoreductase [Flammeovirga pacifica]OHX63875.1 FAD-binding dehydrogenase [Flammeovirga pacifica]
MKRREFFKNGVFGTVGFSVLGSSESKAKDKKKEKTVFSDRSNDNWTDLNGNKKHTPDRCQYLNFDVVVIGGGLAGICAAVSSAREGVKTVLVQDRGVLGGNASSEIRVIVNGVNHLAPNNTPERETGIIEEILLHNRFLNPQESWSFWDHVLYDFVEREPNLEVILNTQAIHAVMDGSSIKTAICWQNSTESELHISAAQFIDCSGDGLLAAKAGAEYRTGREASHEFNEKFAPKEADGWQMGASILIGGKDMGKPMKYTAPSFAKEFTLEHSHPKRKVRSYVEGYWWCEIGSQFDIIKDQEEIRKKLMGYAHGIWDYIKNSGNYPDAENFALEWIGSVPGKRESRRFIGDYILSEKDLTEHKHFEDAVAYGGWSLDEHNPGGIENMKEPPSYFHQRFKKVYEIPFRSLYSKNIDNLLFSGRNISQTHISLSSTRVMATCALMGQATGTAAALCVKNKTTPRGIYQKHIVELQDRLLMNDAYIPNRPNRQKNDLMKDAASIVASSTKSGNPELLTDGWSRDLPDSIHHWESKDLPAYVQCEWQEPQEISSLTIKCDTNVKKNIMMRNVYHKEIYSDIVPPELTKSLSLQARIDGKWVDISNVDNNQARRIQLNFDRIKTTALRVHVKSTYGADTAKLFELVALK